MPFDGKEKWEAKLQPVLQYFFVILPVCIREVEKNKGVRIWYRETVGVCVYPKFVWMNQQTYDKVMQSDYLSLSNLDCRHN